MNSIYSPIHYKDLTTEGLLTSLHVQPNAIPHSHLPPLYHHGVHIMMDRMTGKTHSDAFVEFTDMKTALYAMRTHSKLIIKGRLIHMVWSSQTELLR